jgi:hypothetical protein
MTVPELLTGLIRARARAAPAAAPTELRSGKNSWSGLASVFVMPG